MKIPSKIKIGPYKIEIVYPYKFVETDNKTGVASFQDTKILLSNNFCGIERTEQSVDVTFLHEIIHWVLYVYCGKALCSGEENEEQIVNGLALGLLQVIRDNKLDFSK